MKKLLLTLLAVVGLGLSASAAEDPVYTLQFNKDNNSKGVSAYTSSTTFDITDNGVKFTLVSFNNNNNGDGSANGSGGADIWEFVRCGSKNGATTATITSTSALSQSIDKVVINAKKNKTGTNDKATKAELLISDSDDFTNATSVEFDVNTLTSTASDITIAIPTPAANKYYRISVTLTKSTNNGWLQFNNVKFYQVADASKEAADMEFSVSELTAYLGEDFTTPTLSKATTAEVTYESSNEDVAGVDENTGALTLVSAGTTVITARAEANDKYNAGSASYTLTVIDPNNTAIYSSSMGTDFTFDNPSSVTVWKHDDKYGLKGTAYVSGNNIAAEAYAISPIINLQLYKNAKLTFSQALNQYKNEATVETVGNYAKIMVRIAGNTEWTELATPTTPSSFSWTFYENDAISLDAYSGKQIEIAFKYISTSKVAGTWEIKNINVTGAKNDNVKIESGLAYATSSYRVNLSEEFETPELTNPNNLAVTYTSSNPEVATVAADGKVTLVGVGTTTITAKSAETETYYEGLASYQLTVITTYDSVESFYNIGESNYGIVNFELIVTYKNGLNCYAKTADGAATLIYGSNSYSEGDIIPAGWTGQYSPYNGMPEIKPVGTMPAASGTVEVVVPEVATLTLADVNKVVVLKGVTFSAATPATGNFDGTISVATAQADDAEAAATVITFRNNFGLASVEPGTYNVKLAVASYNGALQAYPIDFGVELTGIESVVADDNAPVEYYNLQGVRVANPANGLYIRRQGNKATKVYVK